MQSVECPECGHRELGSMDFCAQCGAAVFSTSITGGTTVSIDILESGDINWVPHLMQTVACRQLREICEAAARAELDFGSYIELLSELEVYIEREVVRFSLLPELPENETYEEACNLIVAGLEDLLEACAVAGDLEMQGRAVLQLAQQMAVDADVQIGQGRQLLERLG